VVADTDSLFNKDRLS
jgi:hypothetical protein